MATLSSDEAYFTTYDAHMSCPAERVFGQNSFGVLDDDLHAVFEIIPGLPWVVPHILSQEECAEWIMTAEAYGLREAGAGVLRTSKRSQQFQDQAMADVVAARLPAELNAFVQPTAFGTDIQGVHPNLRFVRYDQGDRFPVHQDQGDEVCKVATNGTANRARSTHTLLIALSGFSDYSGGCTRFFPTGRFDEAVDVMLPQGCALVFQQKGVMHCGMEVLSGTKYVAQAGVLRPLPPTGLVPAPQTFKYAHATPEGFALRGNEPRLRREA